MGAQLRVYRRRIRSVQSTAKITGAMELIAASRIVKAQQRVEATVPYARTLHRALTAAASNATVDHPLTTEKENPTRSAVLVLTSDRGLAGAYSSNAIREGEALGNLLRSQGRQVVPYLVGRKGVGFYRFRGREMGGQWEGFSESPQFSNAKEVADALLAAFLRDTDEGGVDELHVVYTHFVNMVTQQPRARRVLPLEVEETTEEPEEGAFPLYEYEPSPEQVLDELLPRYVENVIYTLMLSSAASEHAARRRAMKSATDNANDLVRSLTRQANQARQAEITQEISEIVGGADALAAAAAAGE